MVVRFVKNEEGNVVVMTALLLTLIMGSLAAGLDVTSAVAVQSDVRHISKALCVRAASAVNRGLSSAEAARLSETLGNELIRQTSLSKTNAAFVVSIDAATSSANVLGSAELPSAFAKLFNVSHFSPHDAVSCDIALPAAAPPPQAPASSGGGLCNGGNNLGATSQQIAGAPSASSSGFNSNVAGLYSSQSNTGNNSANSNGSFSGGTGNTSGSTVTGNQGSGSLSCTNASNGQASGSALSGATATGPNAQTFTSTSVVITGNSSTSSGTSIATSGGP